MKTLIELEIYELVFLAIMLSYTLFFTSAILSRRSDNGLPWLDSKDSKEVLCFMSCC